jgi:hypothetical protein
MNYFTTTSVYNLEANGKNKFTNILVLVPTTGFR